MTETLASLPAISTLLKRYGITANKKLGQHFLFDLNLTDKITRHAGELNDCHVIEIGPGPGALTRSILQANPRQLIAIDTDDRFIDMLTDYLLPVSDGKLLLLKQDALTFDYASVAEPVRIIANLPYNIGTELLFLWLDNIAHFKSITVMLQKEVADRLSGKPNSKAYGRLSVLFQYRCDIYPVCDIHPHSFYPPPKVVSSVVHIVPRLTPLDVNKDALDALLRTSFGKRRKTLRASLRGVYPNAETLLQSAGIDPNLRPEALSVEEFCALSRIMS